MTKTIAAKTVLLTHFICLASLCAPAQPKFNVQPRSPIPTDQLSAVAGKQYEGDGQSICVTPKGARLRCMFQRLEGEATANGLWLRSTAEESAGERFRVMVAGVGRGAAIRLRNEWLVPAAFSSPQPTLSVCGDVEVAENAARFRRFGLTEEYSVSMDGVRQDFIVEQRPAGEGELRLDLDVTGATATVVPNGARLTLAASGRKLAYTKLHVVDARARELAARIEVTSEHQVAIVVDDVLAVYPVRIDPTFSDADWISMGGFPGTDGLTMYAAAVDAGGNLYIGGMFTMVGEAFANHIAKWNGNTWTNLGLGVNYIVDAITVSGNEVYAAGEFTTAGAIQANYIAKWDGTSWSALGAGMNGAVFSLAVSGGNLYAGGIFTTAGDNPANCIAKWNGSSWTNLGSGVSGTGYISVRALSASGATLYAGGRFQRAGGIAATNVARWNGTNWSALGRGTPVVQALAATASGLYAGGQFIFKWTGSSWTNLGPLVGASPSTPSVYAMAASGNDVFVGGYFSAFDHAAAWNIGKWNGSSWTNLSSGIEGVSPTVYALAVSGNSVFAGGFFDTAGGVPAKCIARWQSNSWNRLGNGMDGKVSAFAVSDNALYVGGSFRTVAGISANCVAKWDGSNWTNLGSGLTLGPGLGPFVNVLAVSGTNLIAGGYFRQAGGVAVTNIAKWNGTSWSALGPGLGGTEVGGNYTYVNALTVSGSNLYAGGRFTNAGRLVANHVAKWTGTNWSSLGSGVDSWVYALAASGSDLYVGGGFGTAGGIAVASVAKWNGTAWTNLGTGLSGGTAHSLASSGSNLYAGGDFTVAGDNPAAGIAHWNGFQWSDVGGGVDGVVRNVETVAVIGGDLYAGGNFTQAGSMAATCIARWNGVEWSPLASGVEGTVKAVASIGTNLYVGGQFAVAGNKISVSIAKLNLGVFPGKFYGPAFSNGSGFSCVFSDASVGYHYRVQTCPSLASGTWTALTNFNYASPVLITVPTEGNASLFLRAVSP